MTGLPHNNRQIGEEFLLSIRDIYEDLFSEILFLTDNNQDRKMTLDKIESIYKKHNSRIDSILNRLKIKLIEKNKII
jgi:hypothetical protein